MCVQVAHQLVMAVAEHLLEERARDRSVDDVGQPGLRRGRPPRTSGGGASATGATPACRQRDAVGRTPRAGPPSAPGRADGARPGRRAVTTLPAPLDRLPGRREAMDRSGPLVPRKDLVDRCVDDVRSPQAHDAAPRFGIRSPRPSRRTGRGANREIRGEGRCIGPRVDGSPGADGLGEDGPSERRSAPHVHTGRRSTR